MKRYGIVLAAVFALVAAAVSLRAQAQDNDPDRWLKIDGWTGTFTATRQGDFCFGSSLYTNNDSVSGSVRFNERILKRDKIIWKGTTTATVRVDEKWVWPDRCVEPMGATGWRTRKGSGIATGTGQLTINLRTGEYHMNFGPTKIEGEVKGEWWHDDGRLIRKVQELGTMAFSLLRVREKLPVSGLVLSGTETEETMPFIPDVPYNLSWSLQPDECSADSDIPEVVISKPGKDAELVFRNEPGEIDSKAVAYFMLDEYEVPESLPRSLEWTFPEIAGSTLKTKPEDGRGKEVEFLYEGMPEKNSEFGKEREVSVILAPFRECMEPVRHPVRVFFERDGMGNPSGEAPNWFYYWMQTRAGHDQGEGQVAYGGGGGSCEGNFGWFDGVKDPDLVIICNGAQEENIHPITGRRTEGIDMFAVIVIHELKHMTNHHEWWGKFDEEHRPDGTYEEYIRNRFYEHGPAWRDYVRKMNQADQDGDGIPDELEEDMGFDPEDRDSRDLGYPDTEYSAYEAESTWVIRASDEEDWAVPGKQSGGN